MTKRELLKQRIKAAFAIYTAAYAAADDIFNASDDDVVYAAAFNAADAARVEAAYAARTVKAVIISETAFDKHIALLNKAILCAHEVTQNTIWKTQVLKYEEELKNRS